MTQIEKIINYIEKHGSITPLEATTELGVMRLASRICDIKRLGYDVVTETVNSVNRDGTPTRYARYKIVQEGRE